MRSIYGEYWPREFRDIFPYPDFCDFPHDADEFRILLRNFKEAANECRALAKEWTGGKTWHFPFMCIRQCT